MSQKTLNLCLERYNFVKFGETTKSSHTVLCINNAYSVNSDKYRLTPTAIASKHGDGYVFTLNYDFDRPLFTIVQKSYTLDGTSGNIVFEGIDPISKGGSKYLRKVTVSPVKLSDGSFLLEVTGDEYLRIGTTGAALGDEGLESLNEKIVTMGGIEKSVETVGGKQVLKLDAGGPSGAKEIVYFEIDPSDPPSGIYDNITVALSNDKEPVIKIDEAVYFYTSTGTDKYVFVGGYTKEAVGYTEIEVSDDDSVTSKSVDDKVFNMYMLYRTDPSSPGDPPGTGDQPGAGYWICDENRHVITKTELMVAHANCRYFVLNNDIEPDSNTRKYFASVTVISNSNIRILFSMIQTDDGSVAEFTEKLVMADSEGRLYILRSYETYLAGTNHAVLVSEPQDFNSTQKAQGRDNIGAASASDVAALKSSMITTDSDWLTFDGTNNLIFGSVFSSGPSKVAGDKLRMVIRDGETKYCVEGAKLGVYSFIVTINAKWTGAPVNKTGSIYGFEIDFSKNFNYRKLGTMPGLVSVPYSAQDFYKLSIPLPASVIDAPPGVEISTSFQIQYLGNVEV